MEQNNETTSNSKAGKGLGVAGLVLGIVAAVVSFIPCLGAYALIPGIIGVILAAISMVQAGKAGAPRGMAIAGLICGVVGCAIAGYQWYQLSQVASGLETFKEALENMDTTKMREEAEKALENLENAIDTTQSH